MNDYLKSISNLEKDITASKIESPAIIGETPIVFVSSKSPLSTEADISGVQNLNNETPAEYLIPKTIRVRKYRLKK